MKVLVIQEDLVKKLVSMQEAIDIVDAAYTNLFHKKSAIYPAVREMVPEHDGIFGIKSSYLKDARLLGLKAGGFWSKNTDKGKTNHQSAMLLFDAQSGEPVCLMNANYLTAVRTGAAGAVAAKYLARQNSKVVGMIGAGVQSRMQLKGLKTLFPLEKVIIYSRSQDNARRFADEVQQDGLAAELAATPETAAAQADIVVSVTPSFQPVVKTSWLKEGTHVNAMGSDTVGKREWVLDRKPDKIVCDLWEQCSIMGELQHNIAKDQIYAEIGQITGNEAGGRENSEEITFFDSTGISVQDLSVADYVYRKSKELGLGEVVEL